MASDNELLLRGRLTTSLGIVDKVFKADDGGLQVVSEKYQELALRGKVFMASVAAVTIPVNANNLVSVCSLLNPASSGVFLDIIDIEAHAVLATTVVDALGVYFQGAAAAAGATLTTRSNTIQNARLGEGVNPQAQFYTALTHSGTPLLADMVGGWGAVTDGGSTPTRKAFNGKLLVPPGAVISLAMSTAASTASGITAVIRWAEIPYVGL